MALAHRLGRVQSIAVGCIGKALKKNRSTYIVMPTGTGKTRVGMNAIEEFSKGRVLWLTQTEELITETIERLSARFKDKRIGLIKQETFNVEPEIVVGSVQTVHRAENLLQLKQDHFDFIVVDEVHHVVARTWKAPIQYFERAKVLGLTATDRRGDDMPLHDVVGKKCYELSYEEAVRKRLIAKENCKVIVTDSVINGIKTNQTDFSPAQLEKLVTSQNRNDTVIKSYKKYGVKTVKALGMKPKALCFCVDVKHAERMALFFRENGIRSEFLVGNHKVQSTLVRKKIYERFKHSHDIEVLCVVDVLNEGKDVPDINIVLMARPTLSPVVYIQQLGRATRWVEEYKDQFIVLDYVDNTDKDFFACNFTNTVARDGHELNEEDIVLEYYTGPDPIVKEEFIGKITVGYDRFKDKHQWTEESIINAVLEFIKVNGVESFNTNVLVQRNGLPTRRRVDAFFGSYEGLISALKNRGVVFKNKRVTKSHSAIEMSNQQVIDAIMFYHEHKLEQTGKPIACTDLGLKNNLPSIKTVKNRWGSWNDFCKLVGIKTASNKWQDINAVKVAIKAFHKKHGRYPTYTDWSNSGKNKLPSRESLKRVHKTTPHDFMEKHFGVPIPEPTSKYRGVYFDGTKWRSYINVDKGGKHHFDTGRWPNEEMATVAREIALELFEQKILKDDKNTYIMARNIIKERLSGIPKQVIPTMLPEPYHMRGIDQV
jgi:superfamily II DNA or RNA helicase